MTRAHVLAKAVDVIPDPIYYWRERGKGALSITQSRTDISNFRDRITALLAIDRFLAENASAKLLRQHQRKALVNDLWLYVCDLYRTSDSYRAEFVELAGQYLDQVDKRVLGKLPSTHKLAFYLVRQRALDRLIEFNQWQVEQPVRTIPVLRKHGRLRADLPFLGDRSAGVPIRVYRPYWRELDPFVRVEGLGWRGNRLVITGCAYVPSIDITKRRHTSKIVVLRPRSRRRPPVVLPARSFRHPDATAWSRQERYSYDWAGFECEISPRWFRAGSRWLTGDWDAYILVRGAGRVAARPGAHAGGRPGRASRVPGGGTGHAVRSALGRPPAACRRDQDAGRAARLRAGRRPAHHRRGHEPGRARPGRRARAGLVQGRGHQAVPGVHRAVRRRAARLRAVVAVSRADRHGAEGRRRAGRGREAAVPAEPRRRAAAPAARPRPAAGELGPVGPLRPAGRPAAAGRGLPGRAGRVQVPERRPGAGRRADP